MRHLADRYHSFLKSNIFDFVRVISVAQPSYQIISKRFSKILAQSKKSVWLKNSLLFLCLCVVPIGGVFIKDYANDQIEMARIERTVEKSLVFTAANYAQLLGDLKTKILLEKLYMNQKSIHQLLADVNALKSYAVDTPLQKMKGLRWVSPHLKTIGFYGEVQNFSPKFFLSFLRSLDQAPNTIQIIKINNTIYLGVGVAENRDIKGYFLIPFPPEMIIGSFASEKLRLLHLSFELNLPSLGLPLDDFIKAPFTYLRIIKTMAWGAYGFENALAYSIFLLFAGLFLFFKRKADVRKELALSQSHQKIHDLKNNLQAQQKGANLIIHRLHEAGESIGELSHVLLEKSSSTVLSEQEKTKFIRKIYNISSAVETKVIKSELRESIHIKEIIMGCIHFYGYTIDKTQVHIVQYYDDTLSPFISDKAAFMQLMLNLLHKALERTPEQGIISIKIKQPEEATDGVCIVKIEGNGYPFSSEELKNYTKSHRSLFEEYFDLEWEKVLHLAQNLSCQITLEKILPMGNRIILKIHETKASNKEVVHEQFADETNIIRLFPST